MDGIKRNRSPSASAGSKEKCSRDQSIPTIHHEVTESTFPANQRCGRTIAENGSSQPHHRPTCTDKANPNRIEPMVRLRGTHRALPKRSSFAATALSKHEATVDHLWTIVPVGHSPERDIDEASGRRLNGAAALLRRSR
jgi:hypothetical protein